VVFALALTAASGCWRSATPPDQKAVIDPSAIEGSLDTVNGAQVNGWVWDKTRPDAPVWIAIYDGATCLATIPADELRRDLLELGMGNGRHGFDYTTPDSLKDGKEHVVRVKVAGVGVDLPGSPRTLVVEFP
jgi:hypothetical protein